MIEFMQSDWSKINLGRYIYESKKAKNKNLILSTRVKLAKFNERFWKKLLIAVFHLLKGSDF